MNTLTKSKIEGSLLHYDFNSGIRLDALPIDERCELEEHSTHIQLSKKSILYQEGDMPKGIYVLLKGKIKISQLNVDGSSQIHFIYSQGDVFGHRSILSKGKQPVSAIALEDCELMFVEKDHFLYVLKNSVRLSNQILESVSQEFTLLVNRINIFAQKGIKERLALFLLILNEKYKIPGQLNDDAEIIVNRGDLAAYIGTSIENVVRTLKQFKENNYICTEGKSIFITDFESLFLMTGL